MEKKLGGISTIQKFPLNSNSISIISMRVFKNIFELRPFLNLLKMDGLQKFQKILRTPQNHEKSQKIPSVFPCRFALHGATTFVRFPSCHRKYFC